MANETEVKGPSLKTIGMASPVFTMIGGDTPDGAVCGIDGVCVVPDESSTADSHQ